jgi:hypothetical protein
VLVADTVATASLRLHRSDDDDLAPLLVLELR